MANNSNNPLARILKLLTKIEPSEQKAVLTSFAFLFSLMFAYNILKPVRDAMAPQWSDFELFWLWLINFGFSAIAVSIYGFAASRWKLKYLVPGVYGFFALSFVLFYAGGQLLEDAVFVDKAFYVFISLFSLFHVSVFWSLMSDLFRKDQAPRLFGFIQAGASAGSWLGAFVTFGLANIVGTMNLMLIAALILVAIVPTIGLLQRFRTGTPAEGRPRSDDVTFSGNPFAGFTEFVGNPYLVGIAVFILLYTSVSSFAYFEINNLLRPYEEDERTAIWGGINTWVNSIAILTAMFATGRITTRIGLSKSLALVPLLVVVAFMVLAVNPVLGVAIAAWIVLKGGNYAITRPGRETLYTVVDREARFKAKPVVDIVVYRGGDAGAGGAFALLTTVVGLGLGAMAAIGAGIALVWVFVGLRLGSTFRRTRPAEAPEAI